MCKRDTGILPEQTCVMTVPQSDGGKRGTLLAEGLLAFAQLRDVLAAKDSSVVPQEYDYGGRGGPQRAESNFAPVGIGEHDICQLAAERWLHDGSILKSAHFGVKACNPQARSLSPCLCSRSIVVRQGLIRAERALPPGSPVIVH